MTTFTLMVKTYHGSQLKAVDELLQSQFEDLEVEFKVLGNTPGHWVQISVAGEDEVVATSFIRKEIGICPVSAEDVEAGSVLKGYVAKVEAERLLVDVGVLEPKPLYATVSLAALQRQLLGGKGVALKKFAEAYAIVEGLPLSVRVTSKDAEGLQAELAEAQVGRFLAWQQSLLDRLVVLRASKELVNGTLERTRLDRDVFDVEALGLFEFALTCKLGTDAAGLIPKVGRYMRYAVFVVFNSKRLASFLGEQGLTL
ncbi:MAG: DUF2110 family protein [Candidatus Bathyarchaeota archaeon]|nr:DUF2110 family protein [Candidatus Bathyarchaeota archaeon]